MSEPPYTETNGLSSTKRTDNVALMGASVNVKLKYLDKYHANNED